MATARRTAKVELTATAGGMDHGINDARRKLRGFARDETAAAKAAARDQVKAAKQAQRERERLNDRIGSGISSGVKGAAFGLAAAAGFDISGALGGAVADVFSFEKELTRFQIDAQQSSGAVAAFRKEITDTSNATGRSREEVLKGAHAYQILTGDAEGAIEASKLFAEVANATGAQMDDVAASAAAMRQNAHFDPKDFRKGFDVLVSMGHKGSVELRDFAGQVSSLMPMFDQFGKKSGIEKWTEMAAGLQIVRKEFGSVEEAATGTRQLLTQLSKGTTANRFAKHGIKIWDKDGSRRDFMDILKDIHDAHFSDRTLNDIMGGRTESSRALHAELEHYDELVQLKQEAEDSDQVAKDSATYLASTSGRLAVAWERIKNLAAEALTPERIDAFAQAALNASTNIQQMAKALGDVIDKADRAKERLDKLTDWIPKEVKTAFDLSNPVGQTKQALSHGYDYLTDDDDTQKAKNRDTHVAMAMDVLKGAHAVGMFEDPLHTQTNSEFVKMQMASGGVTARDIGQQIAQALVAALPDKIALQVKADGTKIAESVSNARTHVSSGGQHK